ncbi:MAG TPA: GNAT family N-acetyltransferase [Terriglobales bacterium]|nr:GNAT family N-acetyltransferase [Terriglobales bacterium]
MFGPETIVTERLRLRLATAADIDLLHDLWTDPEVRRYLWDGEVISRDTAAETIADFVDGIAKQRYGLWIAALADESSGVRGENVVGFGYLKEFGEPVELELGYGLDPQYWHRGYATEIARALLRFGFDRLGRTRLYARTDLPNGASVRVMERVGMRFDQQTDEGVFGGLLTFVLDRD